MFKAMSLPDPRRLARHVIPLPLLLMLARPAMAQYPGHIKPDAQKKPDEPRAVSILEWVGDPGKPVASRIVPLSVFVNGRYQDGGLYLAQPAPLTVENDTLYELEQAGIPKGTFYVSGGEEVGGAWFGYGKWKPLAPPKPVHKLAPSKVPPKVVQDNDPDRPHFKGESPSSTQSGSAPSDDPDKPTLHRSPGSGGSGQSTSSSTTSGNNTSANDPDQPTLHRHTDADSGQTASGGGTAPEDPDRPHLKKRSAADAGPTEDDNGAPVTSVNAADPDRPKMSHGKPAAAQTPLQATKITGVPPDLQQMAAISDSVSREEHPYAYPWPDPSEAPKMQAAVEQLAIKAVLTEGIPPADRIGPAPTTPTTTTKTPVRTTGPKSTVKVRVLPKPPAVVLSEKDFRAYELAYNGGATLVLTAKAIVGPNNAGVTQEKYVTIIAQPDFNGDPQMRLESVTDAKHLDITPRMKLIDAVDTDGDNRAELIFELMHTSDRQFAIYKIKGLHAEQAFATESLPYVTPSHVVETSAN
jgi:hypothetical protein